MIVKKIEWYSALAIDVINLPDCEIYNFPYNSISEIL